MQINRDDLAAAANAKIITEKTAEKLWAFWQKNHEDTPSFRFSHVLYYFGGLLAISAVTLFVTQAWESLRGLPLCILSTLFFLLGLFLTKFFLDKKLKIPAGIMATFSLCVVPLAVYNLQNWLGIAPDQIYQYSDYHYWISWYWIPMEFATLLIGVVMLYFYRFPFLLFPISVTLWYMSMDLVPLFFHMTTYPWSYRATFSMYFGLAIIFAAVYMDLKHSDDRQDYAFWLYIFGVMAFWGGLSAQDSNSELSRFIYCLINLAMILVSVFLNRRVFAIFGAIGVLGYLGHLSYSVFQNSLGFPVILVFLGILIIFIAARWSRIENKMYKYFQPYIPKAILRKHSS